MPMGGPTAAGLKTYPAIDLRCFELDADGRLDLVLSAQRPEGFAGQWCEIAPDVRSRCSARCRATGERTVIRFSRSLASMPPAVASAPHPKRSPPTSPG
jgi:hypothetical protein